MLYMMMQYLYILLLFTSLVDAKPSLLNPNSVARPSVTYGRDRSSLEKDIAAIFNKVAHGSTAAPPNATTHIPTTTLPPPTSPIPSTTTTQIPVTPNSQIPDAPDFISRPRFKPPLPPEYTNPFADKAILRGSQSEGPGTGTNRRPLPPPPPPPPVRPPPEVERIPIRPPELSPPVDRKKPLNTPAGSRIDFINQNDFIGNDNNNTNNNNNNINKDMNDPSDIIPIINQSPSVTRILSENNLNRPEDERRNNSSSRVLLDLVNKDSMIDVQAPVTLPTNDPSQDTPNIVTEPPRSYPIPEWPDHIVGGMTWDIIVYTLASLFVLLALYAFIICPFRAADSLITKGSYIFLHLFLFVIGATRGGYLFYDAYNIRNSFPKLIDCILLDMIFPCIFSAFIILFYALAKMTKVQLCNSRSQSPAVLCIGIILNIIIFIIIEYTSDTLDLIPFLISALRALPLLTGITICFGFIIAFRCIYRSARRLQGDVLRANFAKMGALPRRPQLKLASRLILSAALLILGLCGVQLYALFGFYNEITTKPLPWWCCQLATRILELCICMLLASVAWLRRTGVPNNKFQLCCCVTHGDNKSVEDMFPAICSKNNAIHNYSLQTGKTVYENNTLKSTTASQAPYIPPPPLPVTTSMPMGNMSLKRSGIKCGTMPSNRDYSSKRREMTSSSGSQNHYINKNQAVKSSSMLFAEDGVVRFRTNNDPEQPMQEVLHRSLTRHEALTAFNLSQESHIDGSRSRNRSGSLNDLRDDKYRSTGRRSITSNQRSSNNSRQQQQHNLHHQQQQRSVIEPPDSPEHSSLSGCSSSDLSESDLTSGGYERVRTTHHMQQQQQQQHQQNHHQHHSNQHATSSVNRKNNCRSLRYKPTS